MTRTNKKNDQSKIETSKKRSLKRVLKNAASNSLSRQRRRRKQSTLNISQSPGNRNTTNTAGKSPDIFFLDTTPSNPVNCENSKNLIKRKRRKQPKMNSDVVQSDATSQTVNLSSRKILSNNSSNEFNMPQANELNTNSMETSTVLNAATNFQGRQTRSRKLQADKVRQKWRNYHKQQNIMKSPLSKTAGVSPNKNRKAETKFLILRLLGDETYEIGELESSYESDANLLQDLDLVILAASKVDYESYSKLLRQEYANMSDDSYKQMRLKRNKKSLQGSLLLDQSDDFTFKKFLKKLKDKSQLNSTQCVSKQSETPIKLPSTAERTVEEVEIVAQLDEKSPTITPTDADKADNDDDCVLIETINEPIVIDEDETINEVSRRNISTTSLSPKYYKDTTGTPDLKFKPYSGSTSKRRSCTAVLNSSDIIILDETFVSRNTQISQSQKSTDDSVQFVSETTLDFIPLVSDNVPKPMQVLNPFSPKTKNSFNQSFFTKSEKKNLEKYNINTYNPNASVQKEAERQNPKRLVIIDGSNVAYSYSRQQEFSVKGLQICIDYFTKFLGHEVKAVVPQMRLKQRKSTDPAALDKLYRDGIVVLTPCKNLPGNSSISYDDRFILQLASHFDAVIVSNDNYRDLIDENAAFKKLILNRVIGYTWVNDLFMVPKDPYGKNGPSLHAILNRKKT